MYNVSSRKSYVRRLGDAGRFRRAAGGRTAPCFLGHTCRPKKRVYKGLAPTPRVAKPSRTTPTTQRRVRVERESPPLSRHQQRGRAAANSRRRRAAVLPDSGDDYVCRTPTPARASRLHTCPVPACASHRSSPADPETCCLWYRVRKLLQIDFLSLVAAKGLLPPAAQKWNIGALTYFIFFVQCAHL